MDSIFSIAFCVVAFGCGFWLGCRSRQTRQVRAQIKAQAHKDWCVQQARTYVRLHGGDAEQRLFNDHCESFYNSAKCAYTYYLPQKWQDVLDAMSDARMQIEQEKIASEI